ncbi:TonB-dependent receptor domain-containing protein [Fretibacter rubidus]|uniref:TonB-dependent receptor domain-containing protein n=1 Tax=Fretibacter rubidus TaxID=570162 RepID=UPI00352B869D
MKPQFLCRLIISAATIACALPAMAQSSDPALEDVIIVTGMRTDIHTEMTITPDSAPLQGGDITYLTARTPGGARIGNGELSGQMQYRGLFGERLNLRVDGQSFASGGPNLMDPVYHYAPAPLVSSVVIDRGVSPVSKGPGLGGGADARFKRVGYTGGAATSLGYDVMLGARSVNESVSTGGVIGAASDQWRFNLLGAYEEGGDTKFGDGVIGGTAFERVVYGLSAGVKTTAGEFSLDLRRQNTDPTGNPPFPMDIQYFDTDFARVGYQNDFGKIRLNANINYSDVAHLMDNFSLRPAPTPMGQRATFADATTIGGAVSLAFPSFGGEMSVGIDTQETDHDVIITNPNNQAFFVTPFPDIDMSRFGGFGEWNGDLGGLNTQLGLRIDHHDFASGDAALGTALPIGPRNLAMAFNAADTDGGDTTFDGVVKLWTDATNGLSWRATLVHKEQMPGYIQRYGWLPINASGGLADGNIYVGDLSLDKETAWIAEAGFDYASERAYLRPTVYIRSINNYIQGTPFDDSVGVINSPVEMIANMNGDPTPLRWGNVDARLVGFDLDAGYDFEGPLRIDGVVNYVRGKRRDINDNLYRIAPPNVMVGLTYEQSVWSATIEGRAVADQNKVSQTNSERATEGYFVFNAYGDWHIRDGVNLSAGVENLFDEVYEDHLSGYNRNGFGDVPIGERLPGTGRGVFLRLSLVR